MHTETPTGVLDIAQTDQTAPTPAPTQADVARATAAMLAQTYELLKVGMFQGANAARLIQVLAWLERFHLDVVAQLPPEPLTMGGK